jgi:ferredoxin
LLVLAVPAAVASPGAGGQGRPDVVWLAGGHGLTVYRAAYSRNGSTAATVSYDFSAKLWRTSDGALLGSVADRPDMPASVAVAPDGSLMAVAYGSSDATPGQVRIIRASDGATVQRMNIHPYGVSSVAFSPDGSTCATAGGDKGCTYGCLGYASCVRACPVQAIRLEKGIAKVNKQLCISCGKCVATCPRKLIKLVPFKAEIHVLCSSQDKGPAVKKVCGTGCLGCRICTKLAGDAIVMDGFLAKVDYTKELNNPELIAKCPGKCIRSA